MHVGTAALHPRGAGLSHATLMNPCAPSLITHCRDLLGTYYTKVVFRPVLLKVWATNQTINCVLLVCYEICTKMKRARI